MEEENNILQMDHYMKAIGKMTWRMEGAASFMLLETHILGHGKIIKLMDLESIIALMAHITKVNLRMIRK